MNLFYRLFFLFFCLLISACDETPIERKSVEQLALEAENKIYRPAGRPFPLGVDWFNVSRPLTLEDIKGRIVILDFWTYGCINCFHANAKLKKLKQQYQDKILIISVHVPKFENEKNPQTLVRNMLRYQMQHPVLNDVDRVFAQLYEVRAWPSFVLLDQQARIVGKTVGESRVWIIQKAIEKLFTENEDNPQPKPIPLVLEATKKQDNQLLAPTKITFNKEWIAISDSLHHRIIVTDHAGKIHQIYGGKKAGLKDGSPQKVRFNQPQGLAFADGGLYVADSANHRLRFINFKTDKTMTIAGQAKTLELLYPFDPAMDAQKTALRSPWDLVVKGDDLYIAMAGVHQIWKLHRPTHQIQIFAGSGKEGIKDDAINKAEFSQPSGLSLIKNRLYVADPESSALRQINLNTKQVTTLIGKGLFVFGDQDGIFAKAKLQHLNDIFPLTQHQLLIADTYNHKIKIADLTQKKITTLIGSGKAGNILNEPADMIKIADTILIADTNNDRILHFSVQDAILTPWNIYP